MINRLSRPILRRIVRVALLLLVAHAAALNAPAAVVTDSGGGDVFLDLDANVTLLDFGVGDADAVLLGTVVTDVNDPFVIDVAYTTSDLLTGTALMLYGQRIFNDTGATWNSFHISLSGDAGGFIQADGSTNDGAVPNFANFGDTSIDPILVKTPNSTPVLNPDGTYTIDSSLGTVVLSADLSTLWFTFATPLADGEFFDIFVPLFVTSEAGTVTFTEHAVVPEPSALVIWSTLATGVAGFVVMRRRRSRG